MISKKLKSVLAILLCFTCMLPVTIMAHASFEARTTAPGGNNRYFYSSLNPFPIGQCTWYAYGRVYEITGRAPAISSGNASTWWNKNKENGYYSYGYEPKLGAIACYTGHVAVVEYIDSDGTAYVSEGNLSGRTFHYGRAAESLSSFIGYIYACGGESSNPLGDETGPVSITFATHDKSDIAPTYAISKDNAVLVTTINKSYGSHVSTTGFRLSDSNENVIKNQKLAGSVSDSNSKFNISCDVKKELDYTLEPNTTYYYQFYVVLEDTVYWGPLESFITTTGPSHTVTYNANGGSNAPAAQKKLEGESLTLATDIPVKDGFTFKGWGKSASTSFVSYKPGEKYNIDSDITLYAVWEKAEVTSIRLDKGHLGLLKGTEVHLTATVLPAEMNPTIAWESTNPAAATVTTAGVVRGVAAGKTTIIAKVGSLTARCTVVVSEDSASTKVTYIKLSESSLDLDTGDQTALTCSISPAKANVFELSWSSSDPNVASVSTEGKVTAVAAGICTITCSDKVGGTSATCNVTVNKSQADSFVTFLMNMINLTGNIFTMFVNIITKIINNTK